MNHMERVLDKLEHIDQKLDTIAEKVAAHEAKHVAIQGQIKLIFSILLAAASTGAAALWNHIFGTTNSGA